MCAHVRWHVPLKAQIRFWGIALPDLATDKSQIKSRGHVATLVCH